MARFTTRRRTVGPLQLHALLELPFVWIGVAAAAIEIFPVIDRRRLGLKFRRFFVAIGAGRSQVTTCKNEARLLVLRDAERGWFVAIERMAAIAGVEIGRGNELPSVLVSMAIRAVRKLHLEQCVFALGNVALCALYACVPALQRIRADRMFFPREQRRLPALYVVAGGTLPTVRALDELAVVRVFVAVGTFLEGQRLFEIAIGVALRALDGSMLAFKRILCL